MPLRTPRSIIMNIYFPRCASMARHIPLYLPHSTVELHRMAVVGESKVPPLRGAGRFEASSLLCRNLGTWPPPSSAATAVPTFVFRRPRLLHPLQRTEQRQNDVRRDPATILLVEFIPGHRVVSVTLDLPKFRTSALDYKIPRALPTNVKIHPMDDGEAFWTTHASDLAFFEQAMAAKDVETAWSIATGLCERILLRGVDSNVAKMCKGKGEDRQPSVRRTSAPSCALVAGAANHRAIRLSKLINRVNEQLTQVARLKQGLIQGYDTPTKNCWKNIQNGADALGIGLPPPAERAPSVQAHWNTLQGIKEKIKAEIAEIDRTLRKERVAAFKSSVARSFVTQRRKANMLVKDVRQKATEATDTGTVLTCDLQEMDEVMHREWGKILRKFADRPEPCPQEFLETYAEFIREHAMNCDDLTGELLEKVLQKKNGKSCGGVDGWCASDLLQLPRPCLDVLAKVLNLIELEGVWPNALTNAVVALIPKGESKQPLKQRPITVSSMVYRLWACARLLDIIPWQEQWGDDTQYAYRPGRGAEDALFELTTLMEKAFLTGEHVYGVSLDFEKCFDTVPQQLMFALVEKLGMHERVLKPLKAMYSALRRRFRYAMGVGKEFQVTNGILQGCPISVIMINALLSVLIKDIGKDPDVVGANYADDLNNLTKSVASLQGVVTKAEKFTALTDMVLHGDKSVVFATLAAVLTVVLYGKLLRTCVEVTVLGVILNTRPYGTTGRSHRVDEAAKSARRLSALPLTTSQKARIVAETLLPGALYGALFNPPTEVKSLRTAIAKGVWGPVYNTRSPAALLTIAFQAHTTDPASCLKYRVVSTYRRLLVKKEEWRARCQEIAALVSTAQPPRGPVAHVLKISAAIGVQWHEDMRTVVVDGKEFALEDSETGRWGHSLRDAVRNSLLGACRRESKLWWNSSRH
eukprot:TRINITY_DN509_c0_g1_i4.p1 TRINITY_DN509_c0_g1~~TRINITY_DN509_c0_g1_i4.p1  ORF type:complete len:924 (+),score=114.49 TRINITY_DN509_c0_g1_i4:185-2956(+)